MMDRRCAARSGLHLKFAINLGAACARYTGVVAIILLPIPPRVWGCWSCARRGLPWALNRLIATSQSTARHFQIQACG